MKQFFLRLITVLALFMPKQVWAQEAYAILSDDGLTITFYYDDQREARGGMDINNSDVGYSVGGSPYGTATTVVIDTSFVDYRPSSTAYWFQNCHSLTAIIGMENLNTQNVTDMSHMFDQCNKLRSLDLSTFNTQNVTNMSHMFYDCGLINSYGGLNVTGFDTRNVKDMSDMFCGCDGLTSLDVTNFNTQNVTNMEGMFCGCYKLTSLNVTDFNTKNVTNMSYMFCGCDRLTSLDVTNFNTQNVTDMSYMFDNCYGLTSIDLSGFDTQNVTNLGSMFAGCYGLTSLDLSNFNTSNVTSMGGMFYKCTGLTSIDLSGFDTHNVTDMCFMFYRCSNLTSLDLSNFDTRNVTIMCSFDRATYTYNGMFTGCSSLTSLNLSGFDMQKVNYLKSMFEGCSSLTNLNLSNVNMQNVTNMDRMFYGCSSLKSLDLSDFNTKNVKSVKEMFRSCSNLTTIYASSKWSTDSVNSYDNSDDFMFTDCVKLIGDMGTVYDAKHTGKEYAHIDGGTNKVTPGYFTDKNASYVVTDPEPYAVLINDTLLTFFYDGYREARDGKNIIEDKIDYREATTAVFNASFANYRPTSTANWFQECYRLATITDIEHLNTQNVTDMSSMFCLCRNLTSLDVSSFDTQNVTNMSAMFLFCENLTHLNVTGFDTRNVTDMSGMFFGCSGLMHLDLSSFKTKTVTNMADMFNSCRNLTDLDISGFNTQNVTETGYMFYNCSSLKTISASSTWDVSKVTRGSNMFAGCINLVGGQGTVYNENHVDHTYARIDSRPHAPGYLTGNPTEPVTAFSSPSFTVTLNPNRGTAQWFTNYYRLGNGGSLTLTGKSNVDNIVSVKMNLQDPARSGSGVRVSSGTLVGDSIIDVNATTLTITSTGYWPQLWLSSLDVTYEGSAPQGTYAILLPQYQTNGTVTSSMDWADEGDVVTLTATPNEGYHLARLYANQGTVTISPSVEAADQYTFTMPAEDVTVRAQFDEGDITTGVLLNVPEDSEAYNAPIYNLQGQRLRQLQRGVNIVGGRKQVLR